MTSILTNTEATLELPITASQLVTGHCRRDGGALIQDAFPMLNDSHREFLLTGITPAQWEEEFGSEE